MNGLLSKTKKPSILRSSSRRTTSEGGGGGGLNNINRPKGGGKMSFTKTISYFLLSFFILYIYALCRMTNHVLLLHQQQQQSQQTTGSYIRRPFFPYGMSSPTIDITTLSSSETANAAEVEAAATVALKTSKEVKGRARLRSSIIREAMMNDAKPWTDNEKKQPMVHIILTRFQQHQGQLKELGMARFYLFETFCLPTIKAQTNQQFLWIIRTDPKLDDSIKLKMKNALQDHPHYLLVESNKRRNETRRFGNVYEFGDILEYDHILSGDKMLAAQYLKAANDHVVIETRLDADDGLHKEFIDIIQTSAKQRFFTTKNETLTATATTITPKATTDNKNSTTTDISESSTTNFSTSNKTKKTKKKKKHKGDNSNDAGEQLVLKEDASSSWVYWCADHHFEWHYDTSVRHGDLNFTREMYCITPGMTLGYGPNVTLGEVPKNQHWKLHRQVGPCYTLEDTNCIMHMAHIRPAAIRARTPTSAGMKNVGDAMQKQVDDEEDEDTKQKRQYLKDLQWKVLEKTMNVTQAMSTNVNTYLQQHLIDIAIDNLKGQCSVGHSCKQQAKDKLQLLINGGGEETGTTTSSSSSLLKDDTSTTS